VTIEVVIRLRMIGEAGRGYNWPSDRFSRATKARPVDPAAVITEAC